MSEERCEGGGVREGAGPAARDARNFSHSNTPIGPFHNTVLALQAVERLSNHASSHVQSRMWCDTVECEGGGAGQEGQRTHRPTAARNSAELRMPTSRPIQPSGTPSSSVTCRTSASLENESPVGSRRRARAGHVTLCTSPAPTHAHMAGGGGGRSMLQQTAPTVVHTRVRANASASAVWGRGQGWGTHR